MCVYIHCTYLRSNGEISRWSQTFDQKCNIIIHKRSVITTPLTFITNQTVWKSVENWSSYGYLKSTCTTTTRCYGWATDCGKMAASADVRFHWPAARTRHLAFLIHIYVLDAGSLASVWSDCGRKEGSLALRNKFGKGKPGFSFDHWALKALTNANTATAVLTGPCAAWPPQCPSWAQVWCWSVVSGGWAKAPRGTASSVPSVCFHTQEKRRDTWEERKRKFMKKKQNKTKTNSLNCASTKMHRNMMSSHRTAGPRETNRRSRMDAATNSSLLTDVTVWWWRRAADYSAARVCLIKTLKQHLENI